VRADGSTNGTLSVAVSFPMGRPQTAISQTRKRASHARDWLSSAGPTTATHGTAGNRQRSHLATRSFFILAEIVLVQFCMTCTAKGATKAKVLRTWIKAPLPLLRDDSSILIVQSLAPSSNPSTV